jgi:hypothetical protein
MYKVSLERIKLDNNFMKLMRVIFSIIFITHFINRHSTIFGNYFLFQNGNVCESHNRIFYPVILTLITVGLIGTS